MLQLYHFPPQEGTLIYKSFLDKLPHLDWLNIFTLSGVPCPCWGLGTPLVTPPPTATPLGSVVIPTPWWFSVLAFLWSLRRWKKTFVPTFPPSPRIKTKACLYCLQPPEGRIAPRGDPCLVVRASVGRVRPHHVIRRGFSPFCFMPNWHLMKNPSFCRTLFFLVILSICFSELKTVTWVVWLICIVPVEEHKRFNRFKSDRSFYFFIYFFVIVFCVSRRDCNKGQIVTLLVWPKYKHDVMTSSTEAARVSHFSPMWNPYVPEDTCVFSNIYIYIFRWKITIFILIAYIFCFNLFYNNIYIFFIFFLHCLNYNIQLFQLAMFK